MEFLRLVVWVLTVTAVTSAPTCDCGNLNKNLHVSEQSCLLNQLLRIISHLVGCNEKPLVTPDSYKKLLEVTNCTNKHSPKVGAKTVATTTGLSLSDQTTTEEIPTTTQTIKTRIPWFTVTPKPSYPKTNPPSIFTKPTYRPEATTTQPPTTTENEDSDDSSSVETTTRRPLIIKPGALFSTNWNYKTPTITKSDESGDSSEEDLGGGEMDNEKETTTNTTEEPTTPVPIFKTIITTRATTIRPRSTFKVKGTSTIRPRTTLKFKETTTIRPRTTLKVKETTTIQPKHHRPLDTAPVIFPVTPASTTTTAKSHHKSEEDKDVCNNDSYYFEPETFFIPVLKFKGAPALSAQELKDYLFNCLSLPKSGSKKKAQPYQ